MLMRTGYEELSRPMRPARPSLVSRISSAFSGALSGVESYLEFRRQRRELLGLDDRMLKDIGLSRADIMRVKPAQKPRSRRT
jgi:uncharacterized protein YjiS (DUF1127 family)